MPNTFEFPTGRDIECSCCPKYFGQKTLCQRSVTCKTDALAHALGETLSRTTEISLGSPGTFKTGLLSLAAIRNHLAGFYCSKSAQVILMTTDCSDLPHLGKALSLFLRSNYFNIKFAQYTKVNHLPGT